MKRYSNLFAKIIYFDNLYFAYIKARLSKRYRFDVLKFTNNLEIELIQIQNELLNRSYKTGGYKTFKIHDPKERDIFALPFKDRVVHHALVNIIEPIFDKIFIYDNYACRKGKGTHSGLLRTKKFLKYFSPNDYFLKCDIRKYFPSVNKEILKQLIRRKIKCRDTLWLVDEVIDSSKDGLPIGNLTSQLFANLYLNPLDHYLKEILRIRYYVRYMDDFIVFANNKSDLGEILKKIKDFLNIYKLELNSKTGIAKIKQGIDFLGYRIWPTHIN